MSEVKGGPTKSAMLEVLSLSERRDRGFGQDRMRILYMVFVKFAQLTFNSYPSLP